MSGPQAGPASSGTANVEPSSAVSANQVPAPESTAEVPVGTTAPTPVRTATPSPTASSTPAPAPPGPAPNPPFAGFFALGGVIEGPGEYRVGTSEYYIEVPAGMRLRWDFVSAPGEGAAVRWGWSDVESGSQLIVSAQDVTDVARLLSGEGAARAKADRNFDTLMNSVSRQRGN